MVYKNAGWVRVTDAAGFYPGQEVINPTLNPGVGFEHLTFNQPIAVPDDGYLYVWVSNESEVTKVWFDDLTVTFTSTVVTQATDYGVWGEVLREQKADESDYRYGYQGQFAEKDEETGRNHFELREYDPVIGRWLSVDPKRIGFTPFVGMGNNPLKLIDPDGGEPQDIIFLASDGKTEVGRIISNDIQATVVLDFLDVGQLGDNIPNFSGMFIGSLENLQGKAMIATASVQDAFFISLAGEVTPGLGKGLSLDMVFINNGAYKGQIFTYETKLNTVGLSVGGGVSLGLFSLKDGAKLDPSLFEGPSQITNISIAYGSVTNIHARYYEGFGVGIGQGALDYGGSFGEAKTKLIGRSGDFKFDFGNSLGRGY